MAGFKPRPPAASSTCATHTGIPVWQRNYCEHVIRNEADLDRIRRYIADNPAKLALDPEDMA